MANPRYADSHVVICWHHGHIPPLARDLGAPAGTYPDPWPDEEFGLILKFDFSTGATPIVTRISE